MVSLTRASISGVRVTLIATVVTGLLQIVILVVLARLLAPADFGIYVLATTVPKLSTLFLLSTVERALVVYRQFENLEGLSLPVFLVTTALALALGIGMTMLAGLFSATEVEIVWGVLAASVITSIAVVPRVHLRRGLRFGYIALSEILAQSVGLGAVTIVAASFGWGPVALVAGALAQATIAAATLLLVTRWSVTSSTTFANAFALFRATGTLAKTSILESLSGQAPTLVVAQAFGAPGLGIFNRAYALTQLPIELLTTSMSRVLMSGFVAVQDEAARLRRALKTLVVVATSVTAPLAGGMLAAHNQLVDVVLGPAWDESSKLVPFLVVSAWSIMSAHLFAVFTEATRQFDKKVRLQATSLMILSFCLLAGSAYGLPGAAAGLATGSIVHLVLYLHLAAKVSGTGAFEVLIWLMPGLGAGVLCAGAAAAISWAVDLAEWQILALQVVTCGMCCLAYYALFHHSLLVSFIRFSGLTKHG